MFSKTIILFSFKPNNDNFKHKYTEIRNFNFNMGAVPTQTQSPDYCGKYLYWAYTVYIQNNWFPGVIYIALLFFQKPSFYTPVRETGFIKVPLFKNTVFLNEYDINFRNRTIVQNAHNIHVLSISFLLSEALHIKKLESLISG